MIGSSTCALAVLPYSLLSQVARCSVNSARTDSTSWDRDLASLLRRGMGEGGVGGERSEEGERGKRGRESGEGEEESEYSPDM